MTPQMSEDRKLRELRALTDQQLLVMMNTRLQRGFAAVRRMDTVEASRLSAEIARLLPVAGGIGREERSRLQSELAELEAELSCDLVMRAAS